MNDRQQKGFSLLATVMILLIMGVLIMTALQQQLSQQLTITQNERAYVNAYSQALSALEWGVNLHWSKPTEVWQCQLEMTYSWQACLKTINDVERVIIKGISLVEGNDIPMALYQLATIDESHAEEQVVALQKSPTGWLDFCPLDKASC